MEEREKENERMNNKFLKTKTFQNICILNVEREREKDIKNGEKNIEREKENKIE
jgi:hypothetical protein